MRLVRLALFLTASILLAAAARAQAVRWEPSDADPAELILVFENCSPDGVPRLPSVEGVQAELTGQGSRTEFINFRRTDYVQLTYRLRTRSNSPVTIPAFDVKTDKGNLRVPAFTTSGAARNPSLDNAAAAQLLPGSNSVWAGEVFPVNYVLEVNRRNLQQIETNPDWNSTPLVAEDWSKAELGERIVNGEAKLTLVYRTRAFAKSPGPVTLNSVTQNVILQTGSIGFGLFQQPRRERLGVESDHPSITVRGLPAPAPATFSGAVGQFKLVSKVIPEKAAVGEPITWTLELSGTGNWPDLAGLPQRDVSNDFQVVQPKAKRTPAEGKLFDVTLAEDVVLVPTKPGTYTLGPINFSYFDPKSGTYKIVTAPRASVTIAAPDTPKFNITAAPAAQTPQPGKPESSAAPTAPATQTVPAPAAPAGIPRDPLPGSDLAALPLSGRTLALGILGPLVALLGWWFWLAVRRAQHTDPIRPRREAHARLAVTLAGLRTSPTPTLLLAWQHDTAVLWQLAHAAPPPTALTDAAWSALWLESDRALYSAQLQLPSDWVARAEAALAAKRLPGFNPLRLFLPRNLFPFAALLLVTLVLPHSLPAAGPIADYSAGKFAAAEKSWREAAARNPTDWIAHHNLSLVLAQQDRAGESAAHATVAFVQNPAAAPVYWQFASSSEKSGFVAPMLAPFLQSDPLHKLARLASPATWQRVLIAATVFAAAALALLLSNVYRPRGRVFSLLGGSVLVLALVTAATAIAGWQTYGLTAEARAVIVWRAGTLRSIPTEADTTQKTTALAAGSVALAGKTFLGWTQLTFDNGQTGWVRKDELVPVWQ